MNQVQFGDNINASLKVGFLTLFLRSCPIFYAEFEILECSGTAEPRDEQYEWQADP